MKINYIEKLRELGFDLEDEEEGVIKWKDEWLAFYNIYNNPPILFIIGSGYKYINDDLIKKEIEIAEFLKENGISYDIPREIIKKFKRSKKESDLLKRLNKVLS